MSRDRREQIYEQYERQLAEISSSLVSEFKRSAAALDDSLGDDDLRSWAQDGLDLARHSWRSWEAASEYFRASREMLPLLGLQDFARWLEIGRELAGVSSTLAAAYFRASPGAVPRLPVEQIEEWVGLARQLYRGTWRSASLAVQFFDASPALFAQISIEDARLLVRLLNSVCDRSYDLAAHCLNIAPHSLGPFPEEDRRAFLRFAETLATATSGWADTRTYLEKGPELLAHIQQVQRVRFLTLAQDLAKREGQHAFAFFTEAAHALGGVDPDVHGLLLGLAEELVGRSSRASMDFLKTAPSVLERIPVEALPIWHEEGKTLLENGQESGEAFFRLESSRSQQFLERLSHRIDLSGVSDVLRMYCKALTGSDVAVHSAETLIEKGIGWIKTDMPSTEGTAIYLPPSVEEFQDKGANFGVYKIYATHQASHLEFDTFRFSFEREGEIFPNLRSEMAKRGSTEAATSQDGDAEPLTDMQRFFDLFPDRRLASDIFAVLEDARIDAIVRKEYAGIRRAYAERQGFELEKRPSPDELPLRRAFVENLIRASLSNSPILVCPNSLMSIMQQGVSTLKALEAPEATVEDTAEATIRVYRLAETIPNLAPKSLDDWEEGEYMPFPPPMGPGGQDLQFPEGDMQPYESPEPVDFRGEFKPEMVQLLMRLRQEKKQASKGEEMPLDPELLKKLLERNPELQVAGTEGELEDTSGMFLTNLLKDLQNQEQQEQQQSQEKRGVPMAGDSTPGGEDEESLPVEPKYFYYDEWDFRAGDYRPGWCRIVEQHVGEGNIQFYEQTLVRHAALVNQTRRQFEHLRPEMFRKIKRLLDGEEFDLDAVVEYVVERKTGHTPSEKVYWRRNKVERDVSVAFLIDLSASTDEEIAKQDKKWWPDDFDDDPQRYLNMWANRRAQALLNPPKRIIDVEKESMVVLTRALEAIGDTYAIYGFSGYGRDNVEFYIVKDLNDTFSDQTKKRIDKMAPVRSTRMGPAIRHAAAKLEAHDAKVRVLFLVSDGRPQDHGYGRDRTEKEYAIHDTHMALMEAKRKGIVPFCLTVDRYGHDYLGQMCDDIGYAVVPDIESLPSRITTLYRRLTQ